MWFLVLKLLRIGVKEAKKHKAKKNAANTSTIDPENISLDRNTNMPFPADSTPARNPLITLLETILRFIQFVFGLTVIGLYGRDLHDGDKAAAPAKWVYAVVTAFLAVMTATVYLILPFVMKGRTPVARRARVQLPLFIWESVLCILWLTLFGIFGKMYIGNYIEGDMVTRMRHAVWVDLVNLGLWIVTMGWVGLRWWRGVKGGQEGGEREMEDVEKAGP
ncbi:hypothetical protein LV164_003439 [Aspergillus fumigatus]|nr:hypothetical protein KXX42_004035 [Aspergillus fumigatus]KAH1554209.1 hypothetical protein KXX57_005903 [Aspergillus fumigatus]KAH1982518.1 hypothetical protein KXW88_004563 [Aspergillus fumigatus]KAH2315515.1 hypothetical protein KXV47_001763 [Aspergillus fumigatus]KAH2671523.1 hypothetical protein KXV32_001961 [Aspergillus fumigatus]